ncbi:MAG: beta-lactamase family protein [Bacteroidales bacterium]|nr:beta-lactamase family protein [Bacteroidales bacterium]
MKIKTIAIIIIIFSLVLIISKNAEMSTRTALSNLKIQEPIKIVNTEENELLNKTISNILNKYKFNGNIIIVKNNEPIYKNSLGYSNLLKKTELNYNSVFQLASVSKQFTAMAIMILAEEKKLDYDDLVVKHIKDFPYNNISIRQLLNHTSGLQNYIWLVEKYASGKINITNKDVLELYKKHKLPLNFIPGTRFSYSNSGYVFLALLIEKISGEDFGVFLKERIFDKLEMINSFVYNKKIMDTLKTRAEGHIKGKKYTRIITDNNEDCIYGDKGVFSTIEDMYRWDKALYEQKLISDSTLKIAFSTSILKNNKEIPYGFGWRIKEFEGKRVIYHNGWWHGYKTSITRFVDDKNSIIILNNTGSHLAAMLNDLKKLLYKNSEELDLSSE